MVKGNKFKCILDDDKVKLKYEEKIDDEVFQSKIYQPMISDYGVHVPKAIKLKMEQGGTYAIDHNDLKQLKKLGLDKQDYNISGRLENLLLEQPGNSQEKGR